MMTFGLLGTIAAYVGIAVLLLSLNIASRWMWWIKAGAIVITGLFFVTSYASVAALIGWPTKERPPAQFQLHWAKIVEPNQFYDDPGAIFLWLEELDENNVPTGVPRSYRIPYSPELAEELTKAQEKIMEGEEVAGSVEALEEQGEEQEEARANEEEDEAEKQAGRQDQEAAGLLPEIYDPELLTLTLHEMPEAVMPDKSPF
jgi:hypothetical protein